MRYTLIIVLLFAIGCSKNQPRPIFENIDAKTSGLSFVNEIIESDSLNIMDYDYLYNGGGVGIGDFNLDGRPDIFFTGNMTSSRLYINDGNLKFIDITETAGVTTDTWCTGVSVVDINSDGKDDIHVATGMDTNKNFHPNYFFINMTEPNGPVKFENKAIEMGLTDSLYSVQAAWLDYDKDNDLDLFLINNALQDTPKNVPLGQRKDGSGKSTDKLYRNEGIEAGIPKFVDVSAEAGVLIEGWSLGVTVSDFNNDNYPDVYVANDFISNDILYINQGDGTFKNEIESYVRHQSHNSMGMDVADINNDAYPDLVVLDMFPEDNLRQKTMFPNISFDTYHRILKKGYQPQYVRNMLQLNNGNGTFSEIGNFSGVSATDWSWSPLLADYDNDGKRDLYITNGYVKEITDLDFVDHYNKGSVFGTAVSKRKMLVNQLNAMKGVEKSNFYYQNVGDTKFVDRTLEMGLKTPSFSNGAAYSDLDGDGDLDIVVNNINEEAFLFENKINAIAEVTRNFLRIEMPEDAISFGSKVHIYSGTKKLFAENYPLRGYLSSVESTLHFGLGTIEKIDSVRITWPNGTLTVLKDISVNQIKKITEKEIANANPIDQFTKKSISLVQKDSSINSTGSMKEEVFEWFDFWPLHFRSYDKLGPDVSVGDVDGDGSEDIFLTGSAGKSGTFYSRQKSGGFAPIDSLQKISIDAETNSSLLFDYDSDGDLDLYCANGSSEHFTRRDLWQDELYRNEGHGNFVHLSNVLPFMETMTATVVSMDFDNDGDEDLFVGGRVVPDEYPKLPRSYLLRNNEGEFEDVTDRMAPELSNPGMVTDAITFDVDNDGDKDLMLVGEFMPIQLYINNKGRFQLDTERNGLQNSNGWWNCIKKGDFDGDGDMDFVVGNWGLNNFFRPTKEQPLSLYAADYDQNGTVEPIMAYFNEGKEYIAHPRNSLMKIIPGLRNRVSDYKTYGTKTIQEVFGENHLAQSQQLKVHELASVYLQNNGLAGFTIRPLPQEAQWAPIFDILVRDIDSDGNLDIIAAGNYSGNEVLTGNYDAGNGVVLLGDGTGNFESLTIAESGFYQPQESRNMASVKIQQKGMEKELLIIANQNAPLTIFKKNPEYDSAESTKISLEN